MTADLPHNADTAIVGAGVMGLAIAYNLAARGAKNIVVVDGHYLAWGASGRNGGGVRQQWSTEMNVRLMQESMEICAGFAKQMRINVWMRRGGYLFLAREAATVAQLERNVAVQERCGLPTRMITPDEAREIVPELELGGGRPFAAACYNPTDGIVFPWPFLWGYARGAQKRGVAIHTGTPVTAIERHGDDFSVVTPKGTITAGRVVCAAGAWSPQVAALVGGALPNRPQRHEILSTEPLKPFLKPMVSVLETGLYVSQSLRGELVGGITVDEEIETRRAEAATPPQPIAGGSEPSGTPQRSCGAGRSPSPSQGSELDQQVQLGSRLAFVEAMARELTEIMPRLGHVKVVRQWAGPYDISPDGNPIVGELPGTPGFYVVCGFRGHGFMMAPVVARYYAAYLTGDTPHPLFAAWRADRFSSGAPPSGDREEMFIG